MKQLLLEYEAVTTCKNLFKFTHELDKRNTMPFQYIEQNNFVEAYFFDVAASIES